MNVENELTLLTEGQVWGKKKLEVLKKYGTKSAISDLAILTGAFCNNTCTYTAPDDNSLKGRTGQVYTQTSDNYGVVRVVSRDGEYILKFVGNRYVSIRPVLLSSFVFSQISPNRVKGYNGTEEVEYGEYPQYSPDDRTQRQLECKYQIGKLRKTGGKYTFDSTPNNTNSQGFQEVTYKEYEYNGKKYIRVKADSCYDGESFKLSNGEEYRNGDYVWVEVSPVKWLIDDKTGILVSKIGLLAGIRFHTKEKEYNGDFSETEMKEYLDKYMSKDLFQTATLTNLRNNDLKTQNAFQKEINDILLEIKKHIESFKNQEQLKKAINSILDDYNTKLHNLNSTKGITLENEETLKTGLIMKLNQILQNIKNYYNNNECFYNALNNIEQMIKLLENSEKPSLPESEKNISLVNDIKMIVNDILPFFSQDDVAKIKGQIFSILTEEKTKLIEYFVFFENLRTGYSLEKVSNLEYYSLDEFELMLRTKLHPIFQELRNMMDRDVELEIKNEMNEMMCKIHTTAKDKIISTYLNEINNIRDRIKNLIPFLPEQLEYEKKLKEIILSEIDYTKNTDEILEKLRSVIISLYKLEMDINSEMAKFESISENEVKIRL